jgi:cysteine desulfurase
MIYLDNSATTPVDPRVADAMAPWQTQAFGNPSSLHAYGRQARDAVEHARAQVAALLGAQPREIIFTASGTEADNLALIGTFKAAGPGAHLITSAIEHPAVLETARALERQGVETTILPVSPEGLVDPETVRCALRP